VDDEVGLEAVGRQSRPGRWVAAWAVGFALILLVALAGPRPGDEAPQDQVVAVIVPTADPTVPASRVPATNTAPAATSRPRPRPSRPPLGEDGLVGGLVFGTAWLPD
jgi:hypothetical protein